MGAADHRYRRCGRPFAPGRRERAGDPAPVRRHLDEHARQQRHPVWDRSDRPLVALASGAGSERHRGTLLAVELCGSCAVAAQSALGRRRSAGCSGCSGAVFVGRGRQWCDVPAGVRALVER